MTAQTVSRRIPFDDAFVDAAGCKQWLGSLPLTEPSTAAATLALQLDRLREAPVAPRERLRIAEVLREPLMFVHAELAKRYAGRPVPHVDRDLAATEAAIGLWRRFWAQYSQCLKALIEGDDEVRASAARLLQRALFAGKQFILIHGLARRTLPEDFWHEQHAFYRFAEIFDCATQAVDDPFLPGGESVSCYSTYSHALLLSLADPCALNVKQIELVDRWLAMWGRKVHPVAKPAPSDEPLLAVDLEGRGGAAVIASMPGAPPVSLRIGHTAKLAKSVRGRVKKLGDGESPADLNLGPDCSRDVCVDLLKHLYARWCLVQKPLARDAVESSVSLCGGGTPACFFRLTGRTVRTEDPRNRYTFDMVQRFSMLDTLPGYDPNRDQAESDWPWEAWQGVCGVAEASLRRTEPPRQHWQLDQLVLCNDAGEIRLGYLVWIAEEGERAEGTQGAEATPAAQVVRGLAADLRFWPGSVEPVVLASSDELLKKEPPFPALFLKSLPEDRGGLVLPSRTYAPGRRLQATGGAPRSIRLTRLVQRGADFERAAYEPA